MKQFIPEVSSVTKNVLLTPQENGYSRIHAPADGGGIVIRPFSCTENRFLSFYITAHIDHSLPLYLKFYGENPDSPALSFRFGILGNVKTFVCIDFQWLDGASVFCEAARGGLKIVCSGRRIAREAVTKIELTAAPCHHDNELTISPILFSEEYPEHDPLPDVKLVDKFGQSRQHDWSSRIPDEETLKARLTRQAQESGDGYPFADWSAFGGWKKKKLTEGTGFFGTKKENGRWWLVDPEGYAFFSVGPDCVCCNADARVDGIENWLDWLPEQDDPVYGEFLHVRRMGHAGTVSPAPKKFFNFEGANMKRVFGDAWYPTWQKIVTGQLRRHGMNTIANWSDDGLFGVTKTPYVFQLPQFPSTKTRIFRDFPDVLSEEYAENAKASAQSLAARRDDPYQIGYFLRNEAEWAFVDRLVLADEVLYNEERTVCKEVLIAEMREKYGTVEKLNEAWNTAFASFDDLYTRQNRISERSDAAKADMTAFSRKLVRAYVEIPSKACRAVDPNHLILGMRWAWISDPGLVTGWENFDVFSINCYAVDPTNSIQHVVDLGVDLPVMIGEFHFGALDAGPSSTGLEGVRTQKDRGIAYRYYCERAAAHPAGVGCHYFQCFDQFALGRFDGENYNIGLFDTCVQPYPDMMNEVFACGETLYEVADGTKAPTEIKAESIPMVAF